MSVVPTHKTITNIKVMPYKMIKNGLRDTHVSILNNWETERNYGNPFGVTDWKDGALLKDRGNVSDVAELYKLWLQNDNVGLRENGISNEDLSILATLNERREWIRKQISNGKLRDKILVTNLNNDYSYAHVLRDFIDGVIKLDPDDKTVHRIEQRFTVHVPASSHNEDTHIIKELITFKDGTTKPNIRILTNYRRPFYVTKKHFQDHKQKKEFEEIHKVQQYMSTESTLANEVGRKTGRVGYSRNILRDVRDSPYVYGLDIDSRVFINKMYKDKYPGPTTDLTNCVLDIESDIETKVITVITIAMKRKIYTVATDEFIKKVGKDGLREKILKLVDENIPDVNIEGVTLDKKDLNIDITTASTPGKAIEKIFSKIHDWSPDILSIWNMMFDIPMIIKALDNENIDPKDIFSDPSIPKQLRRFKLKPGPIQSVKESGLVTPIDYHQQWHTLISTSSFYVIDAMCTYNYVRAGANGVAGGYGLDNILVVELGEGLGKLKFTMGEGLVKADWHNYMSKNHPLEYITYNIWDCLSMVLLDEKTTDISTNLSILSGYSSFDKFSSGPKKIIDKLYFDAMSSGYVMGSKPSKVEGDKILGLSNWIVTLEAFRIEDNGLRLIDGDDSITTNIKAFAFDLDAVSSYPSDTVAANLSADTTKREIVRISGVPKSVFMEENMNLIYGPVNAVRYCHNMLKFPTLTELGKEIKNNTVQHMTSE